MLVICGCACLLQVSNTNTNNDKVTDNFTCLQSQFMHMCYKMHVFLTDLVLSRRYVILWMLHIYSQSMQCICCSFIALSQLSSYGTYPFLHWLDLKQSFLIYVACSQIRYVLSSIKLLCMQFKPLNITKGTPGQARGHPTHINCLLEVWYAL